MMSITKKKADRIISYFKDEHGNAPFPAVIFTDRLINEYFFGRKETLHELARIWRKCDKSGKKTLNEIFEGEIRKCHHIQGRRCDECHTIPLDSFIEHKRGEFEDHTVHNLYRFLLNLVEGEPEF